MITTWSGAFGVINGSECVLVDGALSGIVFYDLDTEASLVAPIIGYVGMGICCHLINGLRGDFIDKHIPVSRTI